MRERGGAKRQAPIHPSGGAKCAPAVCFLYANSRTAYGIASQYAHADSYASGFACTNRYTTARFAFTRRYAAADTVSFPYKRGDQASCADDWYDI